MQSECKQICLVMERVHIGTISHYFNSATPILDVICQRQLSPSCISILKVGLYIWAVALSEAITTVLLGNLAPCGVADGGAVSTSGRENVLLV